MNKVLCFIVKTSLLLGSVLPISFCSNNNLEEGRFVFQDDELIKYKLIENRLGHPLEIGESLLPYDFTSTFYSFYKEYINENKFSNNIDIGFYVKKTNGMFLEAKYQLYDGSFMPCEPRVKIHKGTYLPWYNMTLEEDYYNRESPYYDTKVCTYKNGNIHIEIGDFGFTNVEYLVLSITVSYYGDYVTEEGEKLTGYGLESQAKIAYKI